MTPVKAGFPNDGFLRLTPRIWALAWVIWGRISGSNPKNNIYYIVYYPVTRVKSILISVVSQFLCCSGAL